jgi:hypothetical protein
MVAHTSAAAQDTSWTREARRARREKPWFHDKPLGDERAWALHTAILGFVTAGLAPAAVLMTVGWARFATAHVIGTSIGGVVGGYLVGRFLYAKRDVLRERGLGAFAVVALFVGFVWGLVVGGVCGPALVWLQGSIQFMPIEEWVVLSGGPSAIAAGVTCAWFAPAYATLHATRKSPWWVFLIGAPVSVVIGGFALVASTIVLTVTDGL